jgi:outer membrane protein OmpA-like peptidoglycan-associated protein
MKGFLIVALALLLFTGGCGVNKKYVSDEIAASEARTNAQVSDLKGSADKNKADIAALQRLSKELGEKADLAINKASGFENYQIIWSGEIHFAFDSYDIDGVAAAILDECGVKMEEVPSSLLEVTGYTDRTGSSNYNLMLGQARADATTRYLSEKFGVSLYRMFTASYGKSKPVAMPDEANSAAKNRRVKLAVWGPMK